MNRRKSSLLLLAALLFTGTGVAHGQEPGLDVQVTLSATTVTLGERLHLTVIVQHPSALLVSVEPPTRSATLSLDQIIPPVDTPDGTNVNSQFEYVVAAFSLGSVDVAPLRISWLDSNGNTGSVMAIPPPLTVRSTSAPGDTTLRPLKPQMSIGGAPRWWQQARTWQGIALVAVALMATVVVVRRVRQRTSSSPALPPDDSVETEARDRLEALVASAPLRRGDYDEYYGTIASVVRDYLEDRFAFSARALTTTELQQRMVSLGVERWQARLVSGLLDRCDSAVYAGRQPDPASADHDLTIAFEIIELARRSPEFVDLRA